MINKATIEINKDALVRELNKRGYNLTDANREMGRSDAYLHGCCNRGLITEATAKSLEAIFNIKRESFVVDRRVPEEKKQSVERLDVETFRKLIADAVYDGVTRALKQ